MFHKEIKLLIFNDISKRHFYTTQIMLLFTKKIIWYLAKYTVYICASNSSLQFHIKKRDYLIHL